MVRVIMLVDMALTQEDARRKLCRGLRGSTVETAVKGTVNSIVFLAMSYNMMKKAVVGQLCL